MSGDRRSGDLPTVEALADRARIELRDWTDRTDHDPGVALLELFALVGELLSSHSERLAAEAHLGTGHRRRSAGHRREIELGVDGRRSHQVNDGAGGAPSGPAWGIHRGVVLDGADPLGQSRLLVRVPDVSGAEAEWAAACFPAPGAGEVPVTGTEVWVAFESGDPSRPIWLGQRATD